jgi:hypothetical protein
LVNYIHLNPVRAKIVASEQAAAFRWSSLGRFVRGGRFAQMEAAPWLRAMKLEDDKVGWAEYLERLRQLAPDLAEQERLGFATMSRGWAIGTQGWRRAVAKDHAHLALNPGLGATEARALREAAWMARLETLLAEAKRTLADAEAAPKSESWKVELAAKLRQDSGAPIAWIARTLHMGSPNAVRGYLSKRNAATRFSN